MTLILSGSKPADLGIKTFETDGSTKIFLGDYEISLEDFLAMTHYVLTNTWLSGDTDPRLDFVECVRAMRITQKGWHRGEVCERKRLDSGCPSLAYIPPRLRDQSQGRI